MADHSAVSTAHEAPQANLAKSAPMWGLIGVVGTLVMMFLMFSGDKASQQAAIGSFLYGWGFWLSVTLGAFGLTLLHHAVRGQWTLSIIRVLEAAGSATAFLLLLVLFVPLLVNPVIIYEWADKAYVAGDVFLQRKQWLLNEPGFQIRVVIVFVMFAWMAWGFRNSAMRQEKNNNFKLEAGRSSWAAASIVFFMLAATLLLTDVFMSIESHWFSTMYGPWQIISAAGAALAASIVILCNNADKEPWRSVITPNLTRDLGNMMFAFTMLWGYTSISQYLIIWNGNIPEFTSYFVKRGSSMHPPGMEMLSWGALGMAIIIGRFFIPFFVLLSPRTKRHPANLKKICGWIVFMHILDMYILIIPALKGRGPMGPISQQGLFDLLGFVAVGGLWLYVFLSNTGKAKLLAQYDTRLQEAKAHAH